MSEEGNKVTIRMGPSEIQMMEDYMADHEIGNRSDFIRDAISGYIKAQESLVSGGASQGGIFVRLNEVQMATLEILKQDGICFDIEEFARECILNRIIPAESREDSVVRAFKTAQLASKKK